MTQLCLDTNALDYAASSAYKWFGCHMLLDWSEPVSSVGLCHIIFGITISLFPKLRPLWAFQFLPVPVGIVFCQSHTKGVELQIADIFIHTVCKYSEISIKCNDLSVLSILDAFIFYTFAKK